MIEGSSTGLSLSVDSHWWIYGDDDVCKTISNTGEIQEQDCEAPSDDTSIMRKPLCQLGTAKDLKIDRLLIVFFLKRTEM